jgi:hypothetical protein
MADNEKAVVARSWMGARGAALFASRTRTCDTEPAIENVAMANAAIEIVAMQSTAGSSQSMTSAHPRRGTRTVADSSD